jgi:predicted nucleic acid-binding Zn ribbon protein
MTADPGPAGRAPAEQRLDAIVWPALRRMGISRKVRDAQLDAVLAAVVGPHLAPLCRPAGLDRGALTIATAHGALAHQLQLDSPRLIASLNERLGGDVVRRLRFRALDGGPPGGTR